MSEPSRDGRRVSDRTDFDVWQALLVGIVFGMCSGAVIGYWLFKILGD